MRKFTLCMLACCAVVASSYAQDVPVNREKYPDYVEPQKAYKPEPRLMKYVVNNSEAQSRMLKSQASKLPEYWNNADTKYFPPVFNQAGGSCGSASRICYMFTHEINALRDLDGKKPENYYPSHFVWLQTFDNDGKNEFVEFVGVPNAKVYGGQTYSEYFGYQDAGNDYYGWMQGYDKWMNAISNRMTTPTSMPQSVQDEAGRLAAKAWLYNHAGDTDFKAGGLIGLGVASGGQWYSIPETDANKAAGVAGKYYVHRWGTQVDHAVTMVGWDDRIEFDLDGNGVAGEVEKDEKGAWIIVNSWGGWCNDGFIYCPYKYAGPVSNQETGAMTGGYWWGELYHARKNFRPLRVIKLKMDYSHRSELFLQIGISTDLNATEPENIIDMHHFRYAGDGGPHDYNGDGKKEENDSPNPPAIPMLGKWQNKWHEEPMEWCYDVTDFSAGYDTNKPLKYFFIINRKNDTSKGAGNVYYASIVDYEHDLEGVESAFDLGGEKFEITNEGNKLMISAIVYGSGYLPVNNLTYVDGTLSWDAPQKSSHGYKVESYNVYKDGVLSSNTKEMTCAAEGAREYSVTAIYEDGTESAKVSHTIAVEQNNVAMALDNAGFTIPNIFGTHYKECTIEFFVCPTKFANWNCAAGPGWGTYMHHFNYDGSFSCGWDNSARINSNGTFSLNSWQHIAIVVKGNKMTLYKNGASMGTTSSSTHSGLGGFGNLVFNSSSGNNSWQNAKYDEIRIWDHARTVQQIKGASTFRRQEFYGDVLPQGLLAYYKGDVFVGEDGVYYLRDCAGANHASIQTNTNPEEETKNKLVYTWLKASLEIDSIENVYAGIPVSITATRSEAINKMWWTIPSCGITEKCLVSPTVTFTEAGKHTVIVGASDYRNKVYGDTLEIEVKAAPELDASFTMSAETLPCGDHLSLIANSYVDGYAYEWILTGADTETVYGAKAGATYLAPGDYTVTLKITSADGRSAETSQVVHATSVAPVADFELSEPIVLKETPITIKSTSRYSATDFMWVLDGQAQKTTITPGNENQYWVPKYPGKYNITLTASNAIGSNSITKERALVVTNDDSKNGLFFGQSNAKVAIPNSTELMEFTMEFWANPMASAGEYFGIGDTEDNLLIRVNATGAMIVSINGTTVQSEAGLVETGFWNHYAIRRNSIGVLTFFKNGQRHSVANTAVNKDKITGLNTITLGAAGLSINGGIDEFRIWASAYGGIKATCNAHLENPESYVASNNLLVYYDFNQSGGDVVDRSGNGNHGVRSGFGPDGDAWALSKGVFCLYFGDKLSNETITGVEEVIQGEPVAAGREGVYTLSGQYVGSTTKNLPAGMYIVDGKKVVLK